MTNYFSKYSKSVIPSLQIDLPYNIILELSEQIDQKWKDKKISSYVGTTQGQDEGFMTITLNLISGPESKPYFYRLIEIYQPIDVIYPIKITAFQNPPTEEKVIESATKLREELIEIIGDPRIRVIIEMLRQMGETIANWIKENEDEEKNEK